MSDRFQIIPMQQLVEWIFSELESDASILGLPASLFFTPSTDDPFAVGLYGQRLDTPFGVAAGPHTQLAQNIVLAFLCGSRVIELKTVQVLDTLDITKPCINMQDEGYNVEWSQELAIDESIEEYLRAWVLVHALHGHLGFPGDAPGVLFNMSVGYDLAGVQSAKVRRFIDAMLDPGDRLDRMVSQVTRRVPALRGLEVPGTVSTSVTLSTMHGCPPDEIGRISTFLMDEWGLHTSVKLNPTLLGPHELRHILNTRLGFRHVTVPDAAFEHDIGFAEATDLMKELEQHADRTGVSFGVKLTNTLEVINEGEVFDPDEGAMYLSGRPLHALSVNVAKRLGEAFGGRLLMSFAGGADAFNAPDLLASGMKTVTTCSDLLRPGGYSRMLQYVEETRAAMAAAGAADMDSFIIVRAGGAGSTTASALHNLKRYAATVIDEPLLHHERFERGVTKTERTLGLFDCIEAPCTDGCSVDQRVPAYMRAVASGDLDGAVSVTRSDNAVPTILGHACHHPCEPVCLRTHYDEPLAIREIKRFIMSRESRSRFGGRPSRQRGVRVAVIGGGPCGLTAATFLARAGYSVAILESRAYSGGMVSGTIPVYRASHEVMEHDLAAVRALGVEIRHGVSVGENLRIADLEAEGFAHIIVAAGAQQGWRLGIDGEDGDGVLEGLDFLRAAKYGEPPELGPTVSVVGGGDVAMDCARTAGRLVSGRVYVLYRRTREQMPAAREEIEDLLAEGNELIELVTPKRVLLDNGKVVGLVCATMELGERDASGRRRPVEVAGSEVEMAVDQVIVAIGQRPCLEFLTEEGVELEPGGHVVFDPETLETTRRGVWAGGDAISNGPQSIVRASGDGRRIAAAIREREESRTATSTVPGPAHREEILRRRAQRRWRIRVPHLPVKERSGFGEVVLTLSEEAARAEATRCLDCDLMCATCEGVCPNHAIFSYRAESVELSLPTLVLRGGDLEAGSEKTFQILQGPQVAVLTAFCNECGNCTTFCPTAGEPYKHKPRLYLDREDFEAQTDNAFLITRAGDRWTIEGRFQDATHRLDVDDSPTYITPQATIQWNERGTEIIAATAAPALPEATSIDLTPYAVMLSLLKSVKGSVPWLPMAAR